MTSSDLVHQPPYTWFIPNYSGMLTYMEPSLRGKDARAASFGTDLSSMQLLKQKKVTWTFVGASAEWSGWAIADQTLRVLAGEKPVKDENIGLRIFDTSNIDSINLTESDGDWYGVDFRTPYLKLWGLS
jgi:ribose transport system substrate-binding protein